MRIWLVALTVLITGSCGHMDNKRESGNLSKQDTIVLINSDSNHSEYEDIISSSCAIMISPTVQKIDSLKKINGEYFYIIADDNLFYLAKARQYLDSTKTNIIQ